jgi:fluoroquinolone resistance protein
LNDALITGWRRRYHARTAKVSSPEPPSLVAARTVQQPAAGKIQPVPHSAPGRSHVELPCAVGPQDGVVVAPPGPVAVMVNRPSPAIFQTIFASRPARTPELSALGKNSAHSEPVPCISASGWAPGAGHPPAADATGGPDGPDTAGAADAAGPPEGSDVHPAPVDSTVSDTAASSTRRIMPGRVTGDPAGSLGWPTMSDEQPTRADEWISGEDWALDELTRVRFERCRFDDVDLTEAVLTGCVFVECELANVRLNAAVLTRTALLQCTLRRCNLFGAELRDCKLTGTTIKDCELRPLTVDGGDWSYAVLRGLNLTDTTLAGLKLRGADLSEANLSRCDLRGVDLTDAQTHHTVLKGADLRGADLSGVRLDELDLDGVRIDLAQAGMVAAAHGAIVDQS